ncbi:hypothetical protein IGI04_014447 [Brassica rapa subsp. trilocularis]|uniref:Uncharacterized protein n=1 Tax=Brassica rapa subsp. trilocularis TaxID=1813537 RepID=A0ABQ7MM93_BRACM|nr:hypothetical protein IGI04_014447 [Brassica rapa subsp. trilocularis]
MRLHNQTRGGPLVSWCSMEKLKMKKKRVHGIRSEVFERETWFGKESLGGFLVILMLVTYIASCSDRYGSGTVAEPA